MSESKWAAIVYGRTYEADFRFIVTPEDFTSADIDWAWNHIRVTTRNAEKLAEGPRWSLFRNEHHCVVGVTGMVRDLVGKADADEAAEDMTRDLKRRPLYVFLGYAARVDDSQPLPPIPNCSDGNLELFIPLYNYVRQKWGEKPYEISKNKVVSEYREEFGSPDLAAVDANSSRIHPEYLNCQDENLLYLWPVDNNHNLWYAASRCQRPVSLCLGLASQRDILNGDFLNGTAHDVKEKKKIERIAEVKETKTPKNTRLETSPTLIQVEESESELLRRQKWERLNNNPLDFLRRELQEVAELFLEEPRQTQQRPRVSTRESRYQVPVTPPGTTIDDQVSNRGFRRKQKNKKSQEKQEENQMNEDFFGMMDMDIGGANDSEMLSEPMYLDLDGDGTYDSVMYETDSDGDGVLDTSVFATDTDGDGNIDISSFAEFEDANDNGVLDVTSSVAGFSDSSNSATLENPLGFQPTDFEQSNLAVGDIVGEPDSDMENWHQQTHADTCAVVSQEFVLEQLTGMDFSEDALRQECIDKGYYTPGGGTSMENMGKLLADYGIAVEQDGGYTFEDLKARLEQGEKVIVALDADEIWTMGQDDYLDDYLNDFVEGHGHMPGQAPNHAVQVIGIDDSDPNNPMVILNDPGHEGGQGMKVPAAEFVGAWEDSGNFMVATMVNSDNFMVATTGNSAPTGNAQIAGYHDSTGNWWWGDGTVEPGYNWHTGYV